MGSMAELQREQARRFAQAARATPMDMWEGMAVEVQEEVDEGGKVQEEWFPAQVKP